MCSRFLQLLALLVSLVGIRPASAQNLPPPLWIRGYYISTTDRIDIDGYPTEKCDALVVTDIDPAQAQALRDKASSNYLDLAMDSNGRPIIRLELDKLAKSEVRRVRGSTIRNPIQLTVAWRDFEAEMNLEPKACFSPFHIQAVSGVSSQAPARVKTFADGWFFRPHPPGKMMMPRRTTIAVDVYSLPSLTSGNGYVVHLKGAPLPYILFKDPGKYYVTSESGAEWVNGDPHDYWGSRLGRKFGGDEFSGCVGMVVDGDRATAYVQASEAVVLAWTIVGGTQPAGWYQYLGVKFSGC